MARLRLDRGGRGRTGGAADLTAGAHIGLDITYHNGVLRGLSDFSIGVGLAVLFRDWKPRDRLPDWVHSLIQLAVLSALFYARYEHRLVAHPHGHLHRAAA